MRLTTELFPYQSDAVEKLSRVKVGALYMEMGTGKTRTALELIWRRMAAGKIAQVLWLCPYSVSRDLPELLGEHAEEFESEIRIVGIESLSGSARLYVELLEYTAQKPTFMVVDESLLIKNPFAYRTERVISIASRCRYKLILNGTPVSKSEADLFSQWYVLDWRILGYRSYYSFSANHLEMDRDRPGRIVRVLNTDYLARKIAPYTYQCSKADVLRLPDKKIYDMPFTLTEGQSYHYEKVAERLLMQVNEMRPDTIYRLFGALQAVASGFMIKFSKDGKKSRYTPFFKNARENPRIIKLIDVLGLLPAEQCVIYCRYSAEIHDIISILGDRALPFYGEMTVKSRQENKTAFKAGKCQYLVANKSCAQFGLNLQFCHCEIFYNNDWDYGTREQAEDRLHRVGQTQDVSIYDIYARGTLDVTILKCLARKQRMADLFKSDVSSHNKSTLEQRIKAAIHGQLEDENGEIIPGYKRV